MPVPSTIDDLSPTPGSNYPAGSESPAGIDDYLRFHAACIAQLRDGSYDGSDAVKLTGAQTIAGAKTFSSPIVGSLTGTATTATNTTRSVNAAGLATGGGDLTADRTITVPAATQVQAEAGTDNATAMTPLRTAQAISKQAVSILAPSQPLKLVVMEISNSTDNDDAFTFPTAFPVACVGVWLQRIGEDLQSVIGVKSYDRFGFVVNRENPIDGTQVMSVLAVGY